MKSASPFDAAQIWMDATRAYTEQASKTWLDMTATAADLWRMPDTGRQSAALRDFRPATSAVSGRSWYRKPVDHPFEVMMSWFNPTMTQPANPFGWFAAGDWTRSPMMPTMMPPMLAPMIAPMMPSMGWPAYPQAFDFNKFWAALQLMMAAAPVQQAVSEVAAKMTNSPVFATYRSEGGHAVAQIAMRSLAFLIPMVLAVGMMLGAMQPNFVA